MANKSAKGKSSQIEPSIIKKLLEIVPTQTKVYYILWKYAKHLLPSERKINTFEDLVASYAGFTDGMDEAHCERWLSEESVQKAVKYLLKRLHEQKLIELYELYFEKAKTDVQAFQAFSKFSEKFFAETGEDDLRAILNETKLTDIE